VALARQGDRRIRICDASVSAVQATNWRLLLQVDSDLTGMTWGDVGRIYCGLPRQALAARDFSQIIAELQCT
jgi:uncharacterized protein YwqG